MGIDSCGHLFKHLLGSYSVSSSALSTEDIVGSKPRPHSCIYGVWSGLDDMYHYSFSCKIYQDYQIIHDALEGVLGVYQVRRGETA